MDKKALFLFLFAIGTSSIFAATPAGDDFLSKSRDDGIDAAIYTFEKNGDTVIQLDEAFSGNWSEDELLLVEENVNIAVAKKRVSFIGITKGNTTYFDIAFVKDENGTIRAASSKASPKQNKEDSIDVCY